MSIVDQAYEANPPKQLPVGLTPKHLFYRKCEEQRFADVKSAIQRYAEAGEAIPKEWYDEYQQLHDALSRPVKAPAPAPVYRGGIQ